MTSTSVNEMASRHDGASGCSPGKVNDKITAATASTTVIQPAGLATS